MLERLKKFIGGPRKDQGPTHLAHLEHRKYDVGASNIGGYRYVIAATLLVVFYYFGWASNRYATISQLYVKSTSPQMSISSQLQGLSPMTPSLQDAFLIKEFIESQDMLSHLDEKLNLREHFSSTQWDFFARMDSDATEEDFLAYYRSMLSINLHIESSIIDLEMQAFTPEYSKQLVEEMIAYAEDYINETGRHIARQEIAFVEQELERANMRLSDMQQSLLRFQNENKILSSEASGAAQQQVVNELQGALARTRTQEKVLAAYLNDSAAELVSLRDNIHAIEQQLVDELKRLASDSDGSVNEISIEAKRLETELAFATDLYGSALTAVETTRIETLRKLKHLVVIQSPSLPDEALYPRKWYNLITIFVILTLVYGIGVMILATIREHRDV